MMRLKNEADKLANEKQKKEENIKVEEKQKTEENIKVEEQINNIPLEHQFAFIANNIFTM
jgi:hypothetical protein